MADTADGSPVPRVYDVLAVRKMRPSSEGGMPKKIAVVSDNGAGVLTLRVQGVPGAPVYGITVVYQAKAPNLTALTDTWKPFPDEYGFVYRQMFLARCYRYLSSARADNEYAKAQAAIAKALGKDDVEQSNQYVTPERPLMAGFTWS